MHKKDASPCGFYAISWIEASQKEGSRLKDIPTKNAHSKQLMPAEPSEA